MRFHVVSSLAAVAPEKSSRKLRMRLRRCSRVKWKAAENSAWKSNRGNRARVAPSASRFLQSSNSSSWPLQNSPRCLKQTAEQELQTDPSTKINKTKEGPTFPPTQA